MKKNIQFLGVILSFLIGTSIHASGARETFPTDKFKLDVTSDHIVGYLWSGAEVPDKEIDDMLHSLGSSRTSSITSSDEEREDLSREPEPGLQKEKRKPSVIDEFEGLFEEVARDRNKTEGNIDNVKAFVRKIRIKSQENSLLVIESALNIIFEKY